MTYHRDQMTTLKCQMIRNKKKIEVDERYQEVWIPSFTFNCCEIISIDLSTIFLMKTHEKCENMKYISI